jgi:hypothetical protein
VHLDDDKSRGDATLTFRYRSAARHADEDLLQDGKVQLAARRRQRSRYVAFSLPQVSRGCRLENWYSETSRAFRAVSACGGGFQVGLRGRAAGQCR